MNQPLTPEQEKDRRTRNIIFGLVGCGGCLVLVVPLMAAIAIPAFINYVKRSKTSEVHANLAVLETAFLHECSSGEDLSGLRAGPLPPMPGSEKQNANWASDPGFNRLGFAPGATYFSYSIVQSPVDAADIALQARGDLDGDGTTSLFEITCRPSECRCAAGIFTENELE